MAADETSGGQPDAPPEPPREEEGAPPAPQPAAVADDDVDGSASAASDEPPEEEEEIEWTPNAKLKRIAEIDFAEQPASYRSNTKKEELTLEYVENFNRQYVDLYPSRAPLLLAPLNECGVPVRRTRPRARAPAAAARRHAWPPRAARARARPLLRAEIHLHHRPPDQAAVQAAVRLRQVRALCRRLRHV